ncbi:MAG: hypothetical protein GKS01_17835 [Alphaproteobacteria bacterium]|nr:hypothetical protein [Alphaproteobacteria bacterium]
MSAQPRPHIRNVESVQVEISLGELIDKISILEIKEKRIEDKMKLTNVRRELEALCAVRDAAIGESPELSRLATDLKAINVKLWDIEDEIRDRERDLDFNKRFVTCARAVYKTNDRRAELKSQINELLGAAITEEKSYQAY